MWREDVDFVHFFILITKKTGPEKGHHQPLEPIFSANVAACYLGYRGNTDMLIILRTICLLLSPVDPKQLHLYQSEEIFKNASLKTIG